MKMPNTVKPKKSIYVGKNAGRTKRLGNFLMESSLFLITSISRLAVIFIQRKKIFYLLDFI